MINTRSFYTFDRILNLLIQMDFKMNKLIISAFLFAPLYVLGDDVKSSSVREEVLASTAASVIEAKLESCTSRTWIQGVEMAVREQCYYELEKDLRLAVAKCKSGESVSVAACDILVETFSNL